MKGRLLFGALIALLLMSELYLFKTNRALSRGLALANSGNFRLRERLTQVESKLFTRLPVPNRNGQPVADRPPLTLLVFLRSSDCKACLAESRYWRELYQKLSGKGLLMVAYVNSEDTLWARQFFKQAKLPIPVLTPDSLLLAAFGFPLETPFKVLLDWRQEIVYLSGPENRPEEQERFGRVVKVLSRTLLE